MTRPTVQDYVQVLEARVAGKSVPELAPDEQAVIAFTFREAGGLERVRVELSRAGVNVLRGAKPGARVSTAYVFCTLTDWLAFFEGGDAERVQAIDFYGETSWLQVLARLSRNVPAHAAHDSRAGAALGWATSD